MLKVTKVFNELLNTSSQSAVKLTSFFTIHLAPTRKDIEETIAQPFERVTMSRASLLVGSSVQRAPLQRLNSNYFVIDSNCAEIPLPFLRHAQL